MEGTKATRKRPQIVEKKHSIQYYPLKKYEVFNVQQIQQQVQNNGRLYIPRPLKAEIKTVDVNSNAQFFRTIAGPPTPNLLNGCQSGAGFWNRIGAKTKMKSIQIRGNIYNATTTTEGSLRMIIVYDKQTNGVAPTISTVLESRNQAGTANTSIYSSLKVENRDRFEIIRDKSWHTPSLTNTAGVQTNGPNFPANDDEMEFNDYIKLRGRKVAYTASTGAVADISTGGLFVYFIAGPTVVDQSWACDWSARLRFYDN